MPGRQIVGKVFICILVAALVINGAYWIHNVEERTASYSAEKAEGVFNMALQKVPTEQSKKHDIVLEDRKNMKLTGIVEISSFDERKIVMQTEQDQLTVMQISDKKATRFGVLEPPSRSNRATISEN